MDPDTNDIISFQELSLDKENELEELEEENELEEYVTVGFLEKPKHPKFLLRHRFPSKTGGAPAWLDPLDLPTGKSSICDFCEEPLQFLLQIYAPISDKESTFHRMLYVFLCPSMICLLQNQYEQWKHREEDPRRSVKVFRCQLPRFNAFYSSEPPRRDGNDKPLIVGAALCSWCGTWKGEKVCSSCKRARYCSKKHQARHWKSGHKIQCHQIIGNLETNSSSVLREKPPDKVACRLWPEYEMVIEDECAFDLEGSEDISCETSSLVPKHVTDDTYQFLLDKFEADDNKKSWASFQERISKCPSQVLRYSRDLMVNPLWPLSIGRPSLVNIPKCKYCNGSLCYEFQIMPQLLYYLGVKNDSDSLDWGTIVIYTCLASCESNVRYKEEFTWVQLYPTAPVT
ncbi:programmed cell death protein 2-like [Zingiber officinale]|uniref:programmed cell death protein 2-like n=1 Tax=Zingiber officinale TaxID=94328 RepID=UPI001C4D6FA8|nr:programmed cell death protein 2-like [Zingiber officinale]XP_042444836.1 programmed cell death protein 2-like [Zingiber officinale]